MMNLPPRHFIQAAFSIAAQWFASLQHEVLS
jgi:hypothetical protein